MVSILILLELPRSHMGEEPLFDPASGEILSPTGMMAKRGLSILCSDVLICFVFVRAHVDVLISSPHTYFLSCWLGTVRLTAHPVRLTAQPAKAGNNPAVVQRHLNQTDNVQKRIHPYRSSVCPPAQTGWGQKDDDCLISR